MQTITIVINELPYKNDKAWNGLRLAAKLAEKGAKLNVFLLEDGVDAGKQNQDTLEKNYHLEELIAELLAQDVPFLACKTCLMVCGISKQPLIAGVKEGSMDDLADWTLASDKVLTF